MAADAADPVEAQSRVEELRAYMLEQGITADRTVARGFAYEGYENLREGNYERAREAFDQARRFDPYMPQAQFGYAWSLLRAGKGFFPFVNEYSKGLRLAWWQFITDEALFSNFLIVTALATVCSTLIFSLMVIARHQGRARHDLFEAVRSLVPDSLARVAAWTVFLLPLLLWAGGLWLVLYWLALCFRYMRLPEKTVAVWVFIMIGLAPLGVLAVVERVQAATDPQTRVVMSAMQAGYNPETLRRLADLASRHEDDQELHLLLGTVYAKGEYLAEAFDEYQKVLDRNSTHPAALVNSGNIYFLLGEFGQAVNHYKRAAERAPDLVAAHWNLYLAQNELLHFTEADESLARARSLDETLTGQLLAGTKGGRSARPIDEPADLSRIKAVLRTSSETLTEKAHVLLNPVSMASGVCLVFALLLGLGDPTALARSCARCGRAFCSRCRVELGSDGCCSRCVYLFFKKDGVAADTRSEGLARLRRRDRLTQIVRRLVSLVLPGAGHILAGRIGVGFPLMVGWVAALILLAMRGRLLLSPRVPVSDLPAPGIVVAAICMSICWLIGNTSSTNRPAIREAVDGA